MKFAAEKTDKPVLVIEPAAARSAATITSAEIDTKGFDELVITVVKGVTDGELDISFTQSNTSGGSFVASPVAYDFTQIAAGAAALSSMQINLREATDLDRFLKVEGIVGSGTGNFYAVSATLRNPARSEQQSVTYEKRPV